MISKLAVLFSCVVAACGGPALAQSSTTVSSTAASRLNQSRTPHRKPTPGVIEEMTPKELGNFDFDADKGGSIPPDVTALDGVTIRLRGYVIPMDQSDKIGTFALVDDSLFAAPQENPLPPLVQQTIIANMPEGKPTWYHPELIRVEGKLHVRAKKEDGEIVSLFDLDATSVQPVAPGASRDPSTQLK